MDAFGNRSSLRLYSLKFGLFLSLSIFSRGLPIERIEHLAKIIIVVLEGVFHVVRIGTWFAGLRLALIKVEVNELIPKPLMMRDGYGDVRYSAILTILCEYYFFITLRRIGSCWLFSSV